MVNNGIQYFRKKAEKILRESFPGDLIQIDNQGIQVKGAYDLLDLECKYSYLQ